MAKQVLKDFDINFSNHDETAVGRELGYGCNNIGLTSYGPKLRMLRKVSANGMLGAASMQLATSEGKRYETVLYLQEHAECPVNIEDHMFMMVWKVIMSMLWGKTVKGAEMDSEGAEFRSVVTRAVELAGTPNVSDFIPGLARLDLQGLVRKMRHCTKRMVDIMRSRTQTPLPPSPTGLPVVGMLPFMSPQLHTYFTHLNQTYGPLMSLRLGKKTVVVVSSPLLAKQVFKDFDVTFASHDVLAAAREFSLGGNDVFFAPYSPKWRMLRKVSANGMLGHAALDAVCNERSQRIHQTKRHLHENAECPIDIGEKMFLMAFDMITRSLWGNGISKSSD